MLNIFSKFENLNKEIEGDKDLPNNLDEEEIEKILNIEKLNEELNTIEDPMDYVKDDCVRNNIHQILAVSKDFNKDLDAILKMVKEECNLKEQYVYKVILGECTSLNNEIIKR